jgi:branched-chain amino acid transport system permease protein
MEKAASKVDTRQNGIVTALKQNGGLVGMFILLSALPFLIAMFTGQPLAEILANRAGTSKFLQGLAIEVFILAVYALSYDLLLGVTGLLSFGHAMFFAVGAYLTGIMIKSFGWSLFPTLLLVVVAGVIQALLFGMVLPRVKGITFALVTLGMASVFHIVIQSRELGPFTGADVGLQGVITPAFINPSTERLRFYFVALIFMFVAYLVFRRFVNSPTGRVCTAIRDNEERASMLGFNTFYFKLAALFLASITAALAGALHTLYQPIVHPNVASLAFTVGALLMILIGGVGTLSGALIGAAIFRLMTFSLERFVSENSTFLIGVVYVLIVLFLPYGIIGTWRLKSFQIKQGRERLARLLTGTKGARDEKV